MCVLTIVPVMFFAGALLVPTFGIASAIRSGDLLVVPFLLAWTVFALSTPPIWGRAITRAVDIHRAILGEAFDDVRIGAAETTASLPPPAAAPW